MISTSPVDAPHDVLAKKLRGFGVVGILAIIIILAGNLLFVPLSAILVLVWRSRSDTPWEQIGFVAPKSWVKTIVIGAMSGILFKLAMKAIVMPLLGAPAINQAYQFLSHNPSALPYILYAVIVGAGFGEETVFRGYMFERLSKLFGKGILAKITIIIITSSLFAIAHYHDQGWPGVEQAAVTGLVFVSVYAVRR